MKSDNTIQDDDLIRQLKQYGPAELKLRQRRIESLSVELGIHFSIAGMPSIEQQNWQLDIVPHIIDPDEWKQLEAGLIQRAKAFNLFLQDIYSEQKILKQRVIPMEMIFEDPAFLRECMNIGAGHDAPPSPLLMGAVDLARDANGNWFATQQHFSTPFGLSYIIQHRRMLSQSFPELFESTNVRPVASFSTEMVEALSSLTEKPYPHIVLLSKGSSPENYFEESFLARRMGISIVNPADLLVREGRVFLKTIGGLEQVDVIYRRVASRTLDPIAFRSTGGWGIPGLVNCARKGTVAIANGLGSGVADNKSLLRYADHIVGFYLNETPLLRTATTYNCNDRDQLDYVMGNESSMLLKPIHREGEIGVFYSSGKRTEYLAQMKEMLRTRPGMVVGQPRIHSTEIPRYENGRFKKRPVFLRAFVLLGPNPVVLPGGLTRQALDSDAHTHIADLTGGAKDTWIPSGKESQSIPHSRIRAVQPPRDFKIASRVAENFYWIGRYMERAENTARMIGILEEFPWKQLSRRERLNIWPLWQAVMACSGDSEWTEKNTPPRDVAKLSRELTLNPANTASIPHCISRANYNTLGIREFITPEVWKVISRLQRHMESLPKADSAGSSEIREACSSIVDGIAGYNGVFHRTMPHDDGWQFYIIGTLLERAIITSTVIEIVITRALLNLDPSLEQDPDLTTLLRLLCSLDAYQREYRSRTSAGHVAELLWCNDETPGSVSFCCKNISRTLLAVLRDTSHTPEFVAPYQSVESLRDHLGGIKINVLFPQSVFDMDMLRPMRLANLSQMARRAERESELIRHSLNSMHDQIEDYFFSHQASAENKIGGLL